MSMQQKDEGAMAFEGGGHRADNPYAFGTHDWTDWKDGFDQAEAGRERDRVREQVAARIADPA